MTARKNADASTDASRDTDSGDDASTNDEHHDDLEKERRLWAHGAVLAIGGAEDKDGGGEVLPRFVELAGGKRARILIIPTASSVPEEMVEDYDRAFRKLGTGKIDALDIRTREDANSLKAVEQVRNATGIYITGGNQARLVELIIGTRVMDVIRVRNAEGVIVAGTSAGASVVAQHMVVGGTGIAGNSGDSAARKAMVEIVSGLGLLSDVVIDQHFSQRGRMGRLLCAFAANPGLVGIGLDENTAVLVQDGGILETLGEGMVTFIDGRDTTSNYFEKNAGDVLTIVNSSLHVLGPGQRFDLIAHKPLGRVESEAKES